MNPKGSRQHSLKSRNRRIGSQRAVQDPRAFPPEQFLQHRFPLNERQCPKVFTIQEQQVKRDEDARAATEKQIAKDGTTSVINTRNFAIENRAFNPKMFSDPLSKINEATEDISPSGDQLPLAILDVCESTETVDL